MLFNVVNNVPDFPKLINPESAHLAEKRVFKIA